MRANLAQVVAQKQGKSFCVARGQELGLSFVAAGPVECGDGDIVQAEVNADDRAVVDDVVHEKAAIDGGAGHRENDAFAAAERPHVAQ